MSMFEKRHRQNTIVEFLPSFLLNIFMRYMTRPYTFCVYKHTPIEGFVYIDLKMLPLSLIDICTYIRDDPRRCVPIRGSTTKENDEDDDMVSSLITMITPFSCAQSVPKETVVSRQLV